MKAHDSATGYLQRPGPDPLTELIYKWTGTQVVNVTSQLNCGVRSLDWRPYYAADGTILMHHGPVVINHSMALVMQEIVAWAAHSDQQHPENDLVLIHGWDCTYAPGTRQHNDNRCEVALTKVRQSDDILTVPLYRKNPYSMI